MPLPPLPANNTDVVWLKYTSGGTTHEMQYRVASSTTQADIITGATALANALKAWMHTGDSFVGLRHRDSGSTVSFPLAFTAIAGTASVTWDVEEEAKFMSVVGRSLAGYRVKMTFFTVVLVDSNAFRLARTGGSFADAFLDAVDAMSPAAVAIDGQAVVWNQYANVGYNSYWERQLRG